MFTLPNFCRVCLKYDKNLIDLAHIENEPNETLMSKLQLCVSEVVNFLLLLTGIPDYFCCFFFRNGLPSNLCCAIRVSSGSI